MPFDFIGFLKDIDFKKTDNVIGSILKETVSTLDRGRGAVTGAVVNEINNFPTLTDVFTDPSKFADDFGGWQSSRLSGAIEGWKKPQEAKVTNIDELQRFRGTKIGSGIDLAGDVALDPLSYIGVGLLGKAAKYSSPVSKLLFEPIAGKNATFGRRLGTELGVSLAARVGSEVGQNAAEGTPFETPAQIAGGVLGGVGASAGIRAGTKQSGKPVYSSMVEEQLEEGDIVSYLDSLDAVTPRYKVADGRLLTEDELNAEAGQQGVNWGFKQTTQYSDEVMKLYIPEASKDVEIDLNNVKFIERDVTPIPLDHAVVDPALRDSHHEFTTRFYDSQYKQNDSEVQSMLSNWIGEIGGSPASVMRSNYEQGTPAAQRLYSGGEDWRQWANSQPESELIRDFNGQRYVFLYRGENAQKFRMTDGRLYSYDSNDMQNLHVTDPKTGAESLYSPHYNEDIGFGESGYMNDAGDYLPPSAVHSGELINMPIFGQAHSVQSFTGNSDFYNSSSLFTSNHKVLNPETGLEEAKKFILGKWVPVDDVIAPVGRDSGEYEFLVMNRELIPDESYKSIVGVGKSDPRSESYQVGDKSFSTSDEAEQFAKSFSQDPEPKLIQSGQGSGTIDSYYWKESDKYFFQNMQDGKPFNDPIQFYDEAQYLEHVDNAKSNTYIYRNVYEGKPNTNSVKVTKSAIGGYGSGKPGLEVPRKITTGSDDVVDYGNLSTKDSGLLDAIFGNNTQALGFNPISAVKSKLKLKPFSQPSNVLAANTIQPNIPTPSAKTVAGNIPPADFQKLVSSALNAKGIDNRIAATLSSMSKSDRSDLADSLVNNLSLNAPDEDLLRTVINGFEKTGKGDPALISRANNLLRGLWATGDGSWIGIQGLLSIPHMIGTLRFREAADVMTTSMLTLAGNKEAFRKYVTRTLENMPVGAPALNQAVESGLHLSFLKGNQDLNFNIVERLTGNRLAPDAAFAAAGDVARISEFYNTWRRYKNTPNLDLNEIAKAVNRGTGIADKPFMGYIGSFALFAPRFFQSQLEIIAKSFTDGGIEGNLARRQLLALLGTGTALTVAANELRGYETTFDPTDPNFMRIRNVAGQDISVFGPWDSLAKLTVHLGQGDFSYARTKFSPIMSVATNLLMGETFRGEPFPPTGNPIQASMQLAKSMLLPFAWQDFGEGGVVGQSLNFFGVKSSPQSNSEKLDANMTNLGLDPSDPLARRQFLADHPEMRSLVKPEAIKTNEERTKIQGRALLNEELVSTDQISLVDFRESRKILSRELRNKLDMINQGNEFKADTQQARWVEGYYALFDKSQHPVTHDIVGEDFDKLEAEWIDVNGQGAYDYVQSYMGVGKNPIEMQYLTDMRELDKMGYFDKPKYTEEVYKTGLTDTQISDYRNRVSNARNVNPELAELEFEDALFEVLGNDLSSEQIYAISDAGSQDFANKELTQLKQLYPHLFVWFNPKATWSMYEQIKASGAEQIEPTVQTARQLKSEITGRIPEVREANRLKRVTVSNAKN